MLCSSSRVSSFGFRGSGSGFRVSGGVYVGKGLHALLVVDELQDGLYQREKRRLGARFVI